MNQTQIKFISLISVWSGAKSKTSIVSIVSEEHIFTVLFLKRNLVNLAQKSVLSLMKKHTLSIQVKYYLMLAKMHG